MPAAASAQVNAACLRVINEAQDVATTLSEVGPAITAVNLQQLDDVVRRLQSIQRRLDDDLRNCKVEAQVNRDINPGAITHVDGGTLSLADAATDSWLDSLTRRPRRRHRRLRTDSGLFRALAEPVFAPTHRHTQ